MGSSPKKTSTEPPAEDVLFYRQATVEDGKEALKKALNNKQITIRDHRLITQYLAEYRAQRRISDSRYIKTMYDLITWRRFLHVDYASAKIEEIYDAINEITTSGTSKKGTPFKQNTLHDYFRIIKLFYFWLIENEHSTVPKEKIRKIKIPSVNPHTTDPKNLLTVDEVLAIIEATKKTQYPIRNAAILMTLYESGARIGELARLKWDDLQWDKYGIGIYINDKKTNKLRYARLTISMPYLGQLKDIYPHETKGNWVFLTEKNTPMEYHAIWQILHDAVKLSGITKRVHFHLFRKSHITHMVTDGYQESIIKKIHWNNVSTTMFETYVRLSEKDIDNEILNHQGVVIIPEKPSDILKPRICPFCHFVNAPTINYCGDCGRALTEEILHDYESRLKIAHEQKEYQDELKKFEDPIIAKMEEMDKQIAAMEKLKKELMQLQGQNTG